MYLVACHHASEAAAGPGQLRALSNDSSMAVHFVSTRLASHNAIAHAQAMVAHGERE